MGKRFEISESEVNEIKKMYLIEQSEDKSENRKFCHGGNVKELAEIIGDEEVEDYIDGVQLRTNGLGGLVDRLELLKTLRLHPKVSDGGEHLEIGRAHVELQSH